MVTSILNYRAFIWSRAVSDVQHRYAGTGLGVAWNVLHPLAVIATFSLVFTNLMSQRLPGDGGTLAYTFYLCAGYFPWIALSECVTRGCSAFLTNANYLKKLPIPEPVFVAECAVASTLTLLLSFALLAVVALAFGRPPAWTWLLLPLPLVALQALGFAGAMLLGTLNVFFRDVAQWVAALLPVVMWTAPIVYPADILPPWVAALLPFHPLVPGLQAVRDLFLHGQLPPAWTWIGMALWPCCLGAVAWLALRSLRDEIRDVL